MKKKIAIYLAGSIKKEHEKTNDSYWSESDMTFLTTHLGSYEVSFLNSAFRTDNLSDQHSVFGRDMLQVFCCDIVFVYTNNLKNWNFGKAGVQSLNQQSGDETALVQGWGLRAINVMKELLTSSPELEIRIKHFNVKNRIKENFL